MAPVNIWAVIVAAIVMFVIGGIWYGPVFGKQWMKLVGKSQADIDAAKMSGMGKSYVLMFVGSFIMCFVLAGSIVNAVHFRLPQLGGVGWGIHMAFWTWLGFVAPVTLGSVLWENKSWKLWFLNNGYYLLSLLVAGLIIGGWM